MFSTKKFTKRILFVGIPDMAYVCLDELVSAGVNIVGVMGPKKTHDTYYLFKSFVESRKLNFIEWDDLKSEEFLDKLRALNLDAAVVSSFDDKINRQLLDIPKDGFINIHPSLLPQYRGGNPYSAVIINNEKETGVTIHFMDENFDTGDIIAQKVVPIAPNETMGVLFNRLNLMGAQMLLNVLEEYEHKELPRLKQPEGDFIFAKSIKGKNTYIDFSKPADYVERFIRGLNPFIPALSLFRNNDVRIFTANCTDTDAAGYPCGAIVKITDDNFYIKTSKGLISPQVIQFGSFFIGDAKDFIRIVKPKIGEVFGKWIN